MPHDLYRSAEALDVARLEAVSEAAEVLPEFRGFEPGHRLRLALLREKLPTANDLRALDGARLGSVVIEGGLEADDRAFKEMQRLFSEAGGIVGDVGMLAVVAELFVEEGGLDADELQVVLRRGDLMVGGFSSEPPARRREIFKRVVDGLGLPVDVVGVGAEFSFTHRHGQLLRSTGGPGDGKAPESWQAHVRMSPVDALARVKALAGDSADELTWRAQCIQDGRSPLAMEEGREILSTIVELAPAADAYRIEIQLALDALTDLEALRHLCRGEDRLTAPVAGFCDPAGNPAALEVWTGQAGHRLVLSTEDRAFAQEVSKLLGVKFLRLVQPDLPTV